ncbi:MAG: hypothetical protein IJ460_08610 [Clostridia bacterium]|nr:hypothetical protein [Clostridia bacterium]
MSDREKAISIIDSIPDSQVCYVLNMLQNFKAALDEAADDTFCEHLYADYIEDNDTQKDEGMPIEQFAESLGITL